MSDSDLLARTIKGDESSFVALYRRHEPSVFRFALHMSGRVEVAEEVAQEVFLALIAKPRAFRAAAGTLQGFLIGIARNKLRRYLAAHHLTVHGQSEMCGETAIEPDVELPVTDPFEVAGLRAAILGLPPRYREVVVLCDLDEMSYEAAAALLGCAVGTVRSRLHRARRILSAKLQKAFRGRRCQGCAV